MNKVLILFFLSIGVVIYSTWRILQSERVGKLVSDEVTKIVNQQVDVHFAFERLNITILPPGFEIKNVDIVKQKDENFPNGLKINLEKVGVYFNVLDFITNKISIRELLFNNGVIDPGYDLEKIRNILNTDSKQTEPVRPWIEIFEKSWAEILEQRRSLDKALPFKLKKLTLENVGLKIGEEMINFEEFGVLFSTRVSVLEVNLAKSVTRGVITKLIPIDNFMGKFYFSKDRIRIENLKAWSGLSSVTLNTVVNRSEGSFERSKIQGELVALIDLVNFDPDMVRKYFTEIESGVLSLKVSTDSDLRNLNIESKTEIHKIKNDYFVADKISIDIEKKNKLIQVSSLEVDHQTQKVWLKKPLLLYEIGNEFKLDGMALLQLEKLSTRTALHSLRESMDNFDAIISSEIEVVWNKKSIRFKLLKDGVIDSLKLVTDWSKKSEPILDVGQISIRKIDLILELDTFDFFLDVDIKRNQLDLKASGWFRENGINIITSNSYFDYGAVGDIAGLTIKGIGEGIFSVQGPWENVALKYQGEMNESQIMGFLPGDLIVDLNLELGTGSVGINSLKGKKNNFVYQTNGKVVYKNKPYIDMQMAIEDGNYHDLKEAFSLEKSIYEKFPLNILTNFSGKMSVKGPLELDSLMANGNLDLKDMIVYGESLNTGKINLDLKKSILKVNEFELKKIKGKLQGSASINLQKNNFEVAALIDNLDLLEIDFYKNLGSSLTGQIYGQFNLNNTKNFIQGNGDLKLLNSRSSGYAVGDSLIDLRIRDKIIQLEGGLFDQKVDFESTLDLNEKKDKKSLLRLDLNFPEINQLIGIIWGHNLRSPSTLGSMIGQLKGVFDIEDIQRGDFEFFVKEFELKRKDIQMVSNPGPAIIVKGGKIEKWHLVINDSENYIESNGYGDFSDEYNIRTVSKMSASLLEIISPNMRTVSGQIDNVFSLSDYKGKKNRLIKSEGKNLLVDIVGAPGRISDLKYNAKFTEGSLLIESLTGKFAGGDLNMNGEIDFKTQFPKLNLVLEIENSNLQLFSKSNLILSSQLWLSGSKLPYLLSGNVTVHTGQILDELTELKTGGGVSTAYGKYAPKQVFSDPLELFTSELEISITRGLTIKNSLAEMIFRGSAEVVGKLNAPEVLGSFRIIPGSGRFYFKSNDFILKKGDIIFRKADGFSPYFDFLGVSNIASYDVSLGIFGTIEKYDLQILAEPYLSQNDIFSLLALGYTTDSSQVVDEQARQNLASLGIGSLILDRFQIGQGLKSNFGLNVSLSPELVDNDQASLLQGRTGSNANTTSKTSTTTKVKIQKEISKSLNLSVSSTLGGSIEQKQEMNLEYEFNRNFSVLGVYELRENDEGQETAAPDSVGADLKFKRTFKWH